ncbi:MAG: hypothetical protein IIZ17_03545 [Eubacteriaceae bacterium]|nr:hypothetical protein [Eubacteriaceae bacterium]
MRKDGKRVRNVDPMYSLIPYFLVRRYDAMNTISLDIPLEPIQKYLNAQRKNGKNISHLGIIIAAVLRATAEFPALNRFIVNRKIYARNEFSVGMVVLKPGEANDTMNKIYFELEDDIFTVQEKIDRYVEENRRADNENATDRIMRILLAIPGLIRFAADILMFLDRHNLLPRAIIEASPFHATMGITNLASIRTNYIHHHIYDFGTMGMFISMGNTELVPMNRGGINVLEKCIPLGVVMDERIASGHYFAAAFQRIRSYLKDPSLLEGPPQVVNRDFPVEENWHSFTKKK